MGVSGLSPYLRCRLITEEEVLQSVLGRHSAQAAEKFVQEVFWRTYWKGWLELHPGVWQQYRQDLGRHWDDVQTQSGLRDRWEAACRGQTGIACFDFWAGELAETGYLHNHARMWFASIWIFTLELPWELGADFFLRHLLDGDPASNTLSWRWVAGVQTVGKTYLARADNIAKYTEGRFRPTGLASVAVPREAAPKPAPRALPADETPEAALRTGLLLHVEDLSPAYLLDRIAPVSTACLQVDNGISPLVPAPHVQAFRSGAAHNVSARWQDRLGAQAPPVTTAQEIIGWARDHDLQQIVTAYAPVGPVADALHRLRTDPAAPRVVMSQRAYDTAAWPLATKGFFPFKKQIPALLSRLG